MRARLQPSVCTYWEFAARAKMRLARTSFKSHSKFYIIWEIVLTSSKVDSLARFLTVTQSESEGVFPFMRTELP